MTTAMGWLLLQLADSAFPMGGFAHSSGLEAAVHFGDPGTADQLDAYVRSYLWTVGHASLPFVAAAYDAPRDVHAVDALADATLTSHVANRASRTQGRAFVGTTARVFDHPEIAALATRARNGETPAHIAPMFGATLAAVAVGRSDTLGLHLYHALRGVLSAAVRLGVLGPHEAQRMQSRQAATMDAVLAECAALRPCDAASTAPILDIVAATHDCLYARLFQS